jgi:hypothetical protein
MHLDLVVFCLLTPDYTNLAASGHLIPVKLKCHLGLLLFGPISLAVFLLLVRVKEGSKETTQSIIGDGISHWAVRHLS